VPGTKNRVLRPRSAVATKVPRKPVIAIQVLDRRTAGSCLGLTFPSCRPVLLSCSPAGPVIAIRYSVLGASLGLVVACVRRDEADATLLSLVVAPGHRRRGIATALLARLEQEAVALGCRGLHTDYAADDRNAAILEGLFRKSGWSSPRASHISCRVIGTDFRRLVEAAWVKRCRLPREFSLFPWQEARRDELDRLRLRSPDSRIYRSVEPFGGGTAFEPINSIGLRHKGEIVGWMLTRRLGIPGLLLYNRLHVAPPYRKTGRAIAVLAESLRRHYALEGHLPTMGGCFRTDRDNEPMLRFVRHGLGPYLTSYAEVMVCSKPIGENPPAETDCLN